MVAVTRAETTTARQTSAIESERKITRPRTSATNTAMPPPSVAVKAPVTMPPTMTTGRMATIALSISNRGICLRSTTIADLGRPLVMAVTKTTATHARPMIRPGMTPARNRSTIESPETAAMMMARPDGGMMGPTIEDEAVTAAAYSLV